MGYQTAMAWEALANDMARAHQRQQANEQLDQAQRYHCGTIAQLAACLRALKALDPAHPLLQPEVRDVIDHAGERVYNSRDGFQRAWAVDMDPKAVVTSLVQRRAKQISQLFHEVAGQQIVTTFGGFLWMADRWAFWGVTFKTKEAAQKARQVVLQALEQARQVNSLAAINPEQFKALARQAAAS